jgi:hypothetical protein
MGVVIAVFVLGMILIGFTMLALLPLLFVWLAIGVYTEPWGEPAVAGQPPSRETGFGSLTVETPPAESTPERPKVMAAGSRRPR